MITYFLFSTDLMFEMINGIHFYDKPFLPKRILVKFHIFRLNIFSINPKTKTCYNYPCSPLRKNTFTHTDANTNTHSHFERRAPGLALELVWTSTAEKNGKVYGKVNNPTTSPNPKDRGRKIKGKGIQRGGKDISSKNKRKMGVHS